MTTLTLRDPGLLSADSGRLWTPAAATTALWLDAADATTVTTVSGGVSEWRDKSGNNRHVTQSTAGNRPTYSNTQNGLNVITFDGNADWLIAGNSIFTARTVFSWIAVAQRLTDTTTQALLMERVNNNDPAVSLIALTTAILNRPGGTSSTGIIEQTESAVLPTSVQMLGSVQAASSGAAYRNDALSASNSATKASLAFRPLVIGAAFGGDSVITPIQFWWNGHIMELIVSFSTWTTEERQRYSGYLAHKWGITGNLASDHPFKSSPPTL